MNLFWKNTITYVDSLHEWKNTPMNIQWRWDFNLLDRVWVTKTMNESEHSHPWCKYHSKVSSSGDTIEWIIIWLYTEILFVKEWYTDQSTIDGWVHQWNRYNGNGIKFANTWWKILSKDWEIINAHTIKKSHGEFQEVFDHMEEWEKKKEAPRGSSEKIYRISYRYGETPRKR